MRISLLILGIIFCLPGFSQKRWELISTEQLAEIYDKVSSYYSETDSYYFTIQHESFSDSLERVPVEKKDGFYYKSGANFCMDILDIEVAQIGNNQYTVIKDRKEIQLADAQDRFTVDPFERQKGMDKFIKEIRSCHYQNLLDLDIHYGEGVPYSSINIKINDLGFVNQITLYYAESVKWKDENGLENSSKPKVEINYREEPNKVAYAKAKLKASNYVLNVNNKKITPASKYIGYLITDLRIK